MQKSRSDVYFCGVPAIVYTTCKFEIKVGKMGGLAKIAIELHWPMVYIYPKNQ